MPKKPITPNPKACKPLRDYVRAEVGRAAQLSAATGISAGAISRMSTGKAPISMEAAVRLEVATEGALQAAQLSPAFADLITKLKSFPQA